MSWPGHTGLGSRYRVHLTRRRKAIALAVSITNENGLGGLTQGDRQAAGGERISVPQWHARLAWE